VDTLHGLDEWSELPDEIHVLELGVGNGAQARVWLDTFKAICDARGLDYLDRLRYVMADYSPDVLATARRMVEPYRDEVTHIDVDFRRPLAALADLRGRVLFAHACNVHDNLPTDEVMRVGDRGYEPLVRAHLDSVRVSAVRVTPSVDLDLGDVLARLPEWTRVHLSSVAVESLAQTLELLHPEGVLQLQDLFVRDLGQYSSFRGPGKVEGSIVNWLNGPLFQMVGERLLASDEELLSATAAL
jgi:hypothetical protein